MTRVTILDDHELFAEALDLALTRRQYDVGRVPVRGLGRSPERLVTAVARQQPQVVLLDLDLGPAGDGARLVRPLTEAGGAVAVVSATTDRARLGECLRLGAHTVISKTVSLDTVLERVDRVAEGLPTLTAEERDALLACSAERRHTAADRARLEELSKREREVLGELARGRTVDDIARRCCVSTSTVRTQVKAIRRKLGVGSQLAAVAVALRAQAEQATQGTPTGPLVKG